MDSSRRNHLSPLLKNILLMSAGGISAIALLVFLGIWQSGNRFLSGIQTLFNAAPAEPKVEVPTVIINQIRGASELTTAAFTMEAVVPASQERKLGEVAIATTKLLYIAHGEVKAGVDLSQLKADDVTVSDNTVQIQLPPPQILDRKIDVERSKVYDYNRGFLGLGPDTAPQLQTLAQRRTLEKIVTAACSQGILNEANDRAEVAIAQLLTIAGYEAVEVEVTPPEPEACAIAH